MRERVSMYVTVEAVEDELDQMLADLRKQQREPQANMIAVASIEYRIGALRRRKRQLEGL